MTCITSLFVSKAASAKCNQPHIYMLFNSKEDNPGHSCGSAANWTCGCTDV